MESQIKKSQIKDLEIKKTNVKLRVCSVQYPDSKTELFTDTYDSYLKNAESDRGQSVFPAFISPLSKSRLSEYSNSEKIVFCRLQSFAHLPTGANPSDPVRVKYDCSGELFITEDSARLSYIESADNGKAVKENKKSPDGLVGGKVDIFWSRHDSGFLLFQRDGAAKSAFALGEDYLTSSSYATPYGVFPMRACTARVKNSLLSSTPSLVLDYVVQLKGFEAQRIKLRIDLRQPET